jgi:hypothetical protein
MFMTTDNHMGSGRNNSDLLELRQLINNFSTTISGQFEGYNSILTTTDARPAAVEQERAIDNAAPKSAVETIECAATIKQLKVDTKNAMDSVGRAFLGSKMREPHSSQWCTSYRKCATIYLPA